MSRVGNKNKTGIPHKIQNIIFSFVKAKMKLPEKEVRGIKDFEKCLKTRCNTVRQQKKANEKPLAEKQKSHTSKKLNMKRSNTNQEEVK
ncbi:hypothetical protein TKK_0013524 [Trichogramma kaykai]